MALEDDFFQGHFHFTMSSLFVFFLRFRYVSLQVQAGNFAVRVRDDRKHLGEFTGGMRFVAGGNGRGIARHQRFP